jgi:hypothetical protein
MRLAAACALAAATVALAGVPASATPSEPSISPATFAEVASGIVHIKTATCGNRALAQGTGFLVGDRVVMTARHVLVGACRVRAIVGNKSYSGSKPFFWFSDESSAKATDLATFRLDRPARGYLFDFARRTPKPKTTVAIAGFPLGNPLSLHQGRMLGTRTTSGVPTIAVWMVAAQGASGSPFLDPRGDVVGILQRGFVQDDAGAVFGINLVRWWGPQIHDDLCDAYPTGGVPGCAAGPAPRPPSPPPSPPPPPPPPPPSPAPTPVVAGSYKGQTQNGDFVFFDVLADRTIRGFRANDLREECDGPLIVYGPLDFGPTPQPIQSDGSFVYEYVGPGRVGDSPASYVIRVAGIIQGSSASGTAIISNEFDYQDRHYRCSSGVKTWTANRLP